MLLSCKISMNQKTDRSSDGKSLVPLKDRGLLRLLSKPEKMADTLDACNLCFFNVSSLKQWVCFAHDHYQFSFIDLHKLMLIKKFPVFPFYRESFEKVKSTHSSF